MPFAVNFAALKGNVWSREFVSAPCFVQIRDQSFYRSCFDVENLTYKYELYVTLVTRKCEFFIHDFAHDSSIFFSIFFFLNWRIV